MKTPKIFIYLSILAGLLTALVSWLGIYSPDTYKLETANWSAQALGQDYVNFFIAVPMLLISVYFVNKNSLKAYLVWLGTLFYLIYSYILYAFCIHFGPLFLIYIIILSASFYSLVGALVNIEWNKINESFKNVKVAGVSILLLSIAAIFYFLWLSDIIQALTTNNLPLSLKDTGLIVNPVHILDLAFLLPGVVIIAKLLRRHHVVALVLAVPMMLFLVIMGLAIISIMVLTSPDFYTALPTEIMMAIIIWFNLFFVNRYLGQIKL